MKPQQVRFSSRPRPFRVTPSSCQNPECECTEVTFRLAETSAGGRPTDAPLEFEIRVDGETWQEIDPPSRSPEIAELVREFLRDYPAAERKTLEEACREKKQIARRLRQYRIDPRLIEEGKLVSFSEILSERGSITTGGSSYAYHFEHEGVEYLVDDLYCPNPRCRCREVHLAFMRCTRVKEPKEKIVVKESFAAKVSLGGTVAVVEAYDCPRRTAEAILSAWRNQSREEIDELKWRYEKVRQIARRGLARQPGAKFRPASAPERAARSRRQTRRNDPCPCGSGKKFKRCCGQKKRTASESS